MNLWCASTRILYRSIGVTWWTDETSGWWYLLDDALAGGVAI